MADLSQIKIDDVVYDIKDVTARQNTEDLKTAFEFNNWYDPEDTYIQTNKQGITRTGITVNADGSLKQTRSLGADGQIFLVTTDENKILKAGTYTISCRLSYTSPSFDGYSSRAVIALGRTVDYKTCNFYTERGGRTRSASGDTVVWTDATITLTDDELFAFEILPMESATCTTTYPVTIDYIQIEKGTKVTEYSSEVYKAKEPIGEGALEFAENSNLANKVHIVLMNGTAPVHMYNNSNEFTLLGNALYVVTANGLNTVTFSDIHTQIPNNTEVLSDGLKVTLPSVGVFGYDVSENQFKMLSGNANLIALSETFTPLAYRYYQQVYGELITQAHDRRNYAALINNQEFLYTTATARHSFEALSNGGLKIHFGSFLNSRLVNDDFTVNSAELPWENISSAISDYITIDGNAADVILNTYSTALVYNTADKLLHIRRLQVANETNPYDITLWANGYSYPIKGILYDEYINRAVLDMIAAPAFSATDMFNAEPYTGTYDWQTPVVNYGKLFKGKSHVESFAFFTDPHVLGGADDNRNETKMENYLKRVQKVFNSTPCSYLVCGGDWLNNSTTMDEACYRLGYLKGIANHLLDGCKLVLGNHDTNYQGKLDANSENYTGKLTDGTLASIMYRDTDTKKAYYSFDGDNTKCYVLDTGVEHNTMTAYDWEQVAWLGSKLSEDDFAHAIIFLHIITSNGEVQTNASNFGTLVQAYNNHSTVTLNEVTYDFTSCSGHVDFWMAGHTHTDSTGTLGGIPYIITASLAYTSDVPLIDLVLVDYDADTVNVVRVGGTGSNRTISL